MTSIPKALSVGEETFALQCKAYNLKPVREYKFCERGWRFDFAWPDIQLAVEVEGGTRYGRSRHSTGVGFEQDADKYNRAAREGWMVLRYTTRMVNTGQAIVEVRDVINGADELAPSALVNSDSPLVRQI
jgi:hypothetical protein